MVAPTASACLSRPWLTSCAFASAQFFSTTASLHSLSAGGSAAPAQLRWDLRVAAAGCTLALWYPASAPAAAAAAARAGAGGSPAASAAAASSSAAEQQLAGSLDQDRRLDQDAASGEDAEAFSQPGDSLMRGGGESFMSAASQLRGSSAAADGSAAAAVTDAAGGAAATAQPVATQPDVAAAPPDEEDYGRLELECTDVIIDVSAGGRAGGVSAAVRLYALSALEYLPSEDAAYVTAYFLTPDNCCYATHILRVSSRQSQAADVLRDILHAYAAACLSAAGPVAAQRRRRRPRCCRRCRRCRVARAPRPISYHPTPARQEAPRCR